MVVIPYVKNLSEGVARIMRKHGVGVAMRPYRTLRKALVPPRTKWKEMRSVGSSTRCHAKTAHKCTLERLDENWEPGFQNTKKM